MIYYVSILLHILGDYVLQPGRMAIRKSESSWVCLQHVLIYSLPFLLICDPLWTLLLVATPHFIVDRFSLAKHLVKSDPRSETVRIIVYVVVDNGFHLATNGLAIHLSQ